MEKKVFATVNKVDSLLRYILAPYRPTRALPFCRTQWRRKKTIQEEKGEGGRKEKREIRGKEGERERRTDKIDEKIHVALMYPGYS